MHQGLTIKAEDEEGVPLPVDMKAVIADAYIKMLQQKSIDKITVTSLLEACHISRQTFYYHFHDLLDVLEWSFRQATANLLEQSLKAEDLHAALRIFVSFTVQNFTSLRKLLESRRRKQVEQIMLGAIERYLKELLWHKRPELGWYMDLEVFICYNASGIVGVLSVYGGRKDLNQEWLTTAIEQVLLGRLAALDEPGVRLREIQARRESAGCV